VLRGGIKRRALEAMLLLSHFAGYLAALLLVLSPPRAVVFIILQQGLFGLYMGCVFAPNHKGMPVSDQETNSDYLRRRVTSSRNVRGNRFTDFLFGGLNYQIEHHLFPSMPRPNLRRSQVVIRRFCQQRGVPYCESSMLESYEEVLRHLRAVSASLPPASD
jgi:fatty acid desaturase